MIREGKDSNKGDVIDLPHRRVGLGPLGLPVEGESGLLIHHLPPWFPVDCSRGVTLALLEKREPSGEELRVFTVRYSQEAVCSGRVPLGDWGGAPSESGNGLKSFGFLKTVMGSNQR